MKYLFISFSFFINCTLLANELQWVDEQIQAIKPQRDGITRATINSAKNPFIFLKKKQIEKKNTNKEKVLSDTSKQINSITSVSKTKIAKHTTSFSLEAIINKSALINGKWHKLNSKLNNYTLSNIDRTAVTLSSKDKTIILSTRTKNKKLKFKNN